MILSVLFGKSVGVKTHAPRLEALACEVLHGDGSDFIASRAYEAHVFGEYELLFIAELEFPLLDSTPEKAVGKKGRILRIQEVLK